MAFCVLGVIWGDNSPALAQDVVASVGRFSITTKDLLDSYEFGPAFVKRQSHPLRKHLEFMIDERLLALEAERLKYDTTAFVRDRVSALEEDLTVDQLYQDEVLSNVKLSDKEIEVGVQKAKTNLRFRWIFSPEKLKTEQISRTLKTGGSFDSLFAGPDSSERQLETTLLRLESDAPDVAAGLRALRRKEISQPLRGPDGYYIVRLDQAWQNPLTTQTEFEKLKHETMEVLHTSKANTIANQFVRSKMRSASPVIKAEGYNIVRAFLADKGLSRDTQVKWDIPSTFMTEAGPMPINASEKVLSRPLVTFAGRTLTVREYVQWFDIRQFQLKRTSLAAFNGSVKQTIWKLVQDRLLSQDAYSRGLNTRETVQHEAKKWEAKLLYLAARSHFKRTISVSDSALRSRYQKYRTRYRGADGKLLPFEKARSTVWSDVYSDEEQEILLRTLQQLHKQYLVNINEEALNALEATVPPEPRAIDMKFYKPGGTFPRVAYPTIDQSWQSFAE
jgi:hypothetical protein